MNIPNTWFPTSRMDISREVKDGLESKICIAQFKKTYEHHKRKIIGGDSWTVWE